MGGERVAETCDFETSFRADSVSGIVESEKLPFSIGEIEAESHYNQFHSIFQLKEKAHVTRRSPPLEAV
jgi:hypothetical protein